MIRIVRSRRRQRGFALFLALLVLLVLTISGIALMFNTSVEQSMASTETKISKTFYGADSGIEYAGAQLQSNINFLGGNMPTGLSANYPTASGTPTPGEIGVVISAPVYLGSAIHPGDAIASAGEQQICEKIYALTSTATSTAIQSTRTITAQIGVYPQVRGLN
ncbi:MAG: PilX N-terminal domain-containing pilus assembly protein [Thermoanaerobaculia bacterium]